MKKYHDISNIRIDNDSLALCIDGVERSFPLQSVSVKLVQSSPEERRHYEISASGYGIHWPALDEDISIDGLMNVRHEPTRAGHNPHSISTASR